MVTRKEKLIFLLIAVSLLLFSAAAVGVSGKTYTLRATEWINATSLDDLKIELERGNDVIEITDPSFQDGTLEIKVRAIREGSEYVTVTDTDTSRYYEFYVHPNGLLTYSDYFGRFNGDIVIPFAFLILVIAALFITIAAYKRSMAVSMYRYRNVATLGLLLFLSGAAIEQLFQLLRYNGILDTIRSLSSTMQLISMFLLPVAFLASAVMTVSSFILMRREGRSWQNMLGVILGLCLCVLTILPMITDYLLFWTPVGNWVDVHREDAPDGYVLEFFETAIFGIVAYVECILIATIILALKAARHVPKFNKDYILILGCMIRPDGTLTPLLQGRADRAIEFGRMQEEATGKKVTFVPSGGQGSDEVIPEGRAIERYLLEQGVPQDRILTEDRSANTYENMAFSRALIREHAETEDPEIAFSTTNYHVFRSGILAEEMGIRTEGIGAKTKRYFSLNAFVREFVATLVTEKKLHVRIIVLMILLSAFFSSLLYYNALKI